MRCGINLQFLKPNDILYSQFAMPFTPWLSIIDLLMFNEVGKAKEYLTEFQLISGVR
jgi:hypothetical protein